MVVSDQICNIMAGIESAGDLRLHNHRRKLKQRFDIVKKLGQGTYGKVQLGINKETGQEVAIKTIKKCKIETEADLIRIRREIQIMSSVRHPNIIHIYEVFENREKMVLVMEYAAGGELYDYLNVRKILTENEARRIFRQIATAVYYCHKNNICHRDLKLENILLDEVGNAKIADFGLSNIFSYSSLLSTFCGSPLYASPEIVKGTPYVGPEVDCWSLGVLLYTLVYGAMPFDGSNFKRLVKQISSADYFEPENPSSASPLISEMLNVNPVRRADIQSICRHWWINETYTEICLNIAEELARQTPVRLDLLLSLTTPAAPGEKILVNVEQAVDNVKTFAQLEKPVRSQSLGDIPPSTALLNGASPLLPETKESTTEDKKLKIKKKDGSLSKPRRKSSCNSSRKLKNQETGDGNAESDKTGIQSELENVTPVETSVTPAVPEPTSKPKESVDLVSLPSATDGKAKSNCTKDTVEPKPKLSERRKSKIFDVVAKFNATDEKPQSVLPKKILKPALTANDAPKKLQKTIPSQLDEESSTSCANAPSEEPFPLTSTIALNKLVESAFRDEPEFDFKTPQVYEADEILEVAPKLSQDSPETSANKAATLPRRRTSRAEIQLITPRFLPDNYKAEVEHFINEPAFNHKTEIIIPVSTSLPPKSSMKIDSQLKEPLVLIQLEQESQHKAPSKSSPWSPSKTGIARTNSSSLSRHQSPTQSGSGGSNVSLEPIRKSPREVIIPIAVEGSGFATPRGDTSSMTNSLNESEKINSNGTKCFTLLSTKRKQPERILSSQLDSVESSSSDEDDNFQFLTAENLFSTLLSRVRSLTQRINSDKMRSSVFPRTLLTQHGSLFDNPPNRRLSETRSFGRSENAPWRRTVVNNSPKRADSIRKRYSGISEESVPSSTVQAECSSQLLCAPSCARQSTDNFVPSSVSTAFASNRGLPSGGNSDCFAASSHLTAPSLTAKSEARQKLSNILAKHRRSSSTAGPSADQPKLSYSKSSPTNVLEPTKRAPATPTIGAAETSAAPSRSETSLGAKPPRKSRFLRPDFYDTPRENSKYVIQNETVRAFRERSLSRQRDLSRTRSHESFAPASAAPVEYVRGRTRLPADCSDGRREYRRVCSEDGVKGGELLRNDEPRFERINSLRARDRRSVAADLFADDARSEVLGSGSRHLASTASKRKSMLLQNELENEIRKTQNMNTKLNGLMVALSDAENQFAAKEAASSRLRAATKIDNCAIDETGAHRPAVESAPVTDEVDGDANFNALSLLEKKYAYFRKLRNHDRTETEAKSAPDDAVEVSPKTAATPAPSVENDTSNTPPEEVDSDAWSVLSDGTEPHIQDNVNDRIRRRSFYSRFNIYKHKPNSSAANSSPAYSRSLSADYRHRPVGNPRTE